MKFKMEMLKEKLTESGLKTDFDTAKTDCLKLKIMVKITQTNKIE